MPDTLGVWESLSARKILTQMARFYQLPKAGIPQRVSEMLDRVRLSDLADQPARLTNLGCELLLTREMEGRELMAGEDDRSVGQHAHVLRCQRAVVEALGVEGFEAAEKAKAECRRLLGREEAAARQIGYADALLEIADHPHPLGVGPPAANRREPRARDRGQPSQAVEGGEPGRLLGQRGLEGQDFAAVGVARLPDGAVGPVANLLDQLWRLLRHAR